ncbi:MAG: nuclear transport factor 2 family protein [Gemmatimonadetes bacterium]|nr:nuclear transport factor 2 family protein [Gemmatimonadota bacterium]
MRNLFWIAAALLPAAAAAQTAADSAAIIATAHDYIDGWYEGNAERMERSLHGDLAKRIVMRGRNGKDAVQHQTAAMLVAGTGRGGGSNVPLDQRRNDVSILSIFENAAMVRIEASDWVDFLQVGKVDDRWVIINVLWAFRPEALERMRGGGR